MIPFQLNMADKEKPRSIRFPESLWNAIDEDAKRCKRSAVKHMEALLSTYYGLSDSELNLERMYLIGANSFRAVMLPTQESNQLAENAILASTDQREESKPRIITLPVTAEANKEQSEDKKLRRREG